MIIGKNLLKRKASIIWKCAVLLLFMKSIFQERQAAYQQARERIFGKFSPEEETESEADLGPTLVPLPPTTVNSPTGMLQPRMQFSAPVPRPRAPVAALRTIRAPHFQPIPACQGRPFKT